MPPRKPKTKPTPALDAQAPTQTRSGRLVRAQTKPKTGKPQPMGKPLPKPVVLPETSTMRPKPCVVQKKAAPEPELNMPSDGRPVSNHHASACQSDTDENNAQSVKNIDTNASAHPSDHPDDRPPNQPTEVTISGHVSGPADLFNETEATLAGPVPCPAGLNDDTDPSCWLSPDTEDRWAVSNLLRREVFQEENIVEDDLPPSSPPYLAEDNALDIEEPPRMDESDAFGSNYSSDVRCREKQEAAKTAALPNGPIATLANPVPSKASTSKASTSKAVAKSVSGRKACKASLKTTALPSDLEMDEEEDISGNDDDNEAGDNEGHGSGKAQRKGPLTVEALAECDALGEKIEAMVQELMDKHQKSPRYILKRASLALSFSRKYNFWNIHQTWFYGTQAEEGEDPAVLKQRQHEHYQQIKATPKEDALWTEIIEYSKAKETYSGPKTPAGQLMQVRDMFTQMLFCSGEEADRDRNRRALKYMFLDLLVQRGYSGTSVLWRKLLKHLGDRYEAELKEIAENSKRSKGKGKGKTKCHNDKDDEDDEDVERPDPNNDIRFVAWSEATMKKIERSKNARQTPLLVSHNLEDLFYMRDLEPVVEDSRPNVLEGPEANEGNNEEECERHCCSPSPHQHSPTPRPLSASPQHSPAGLSLTIGDLSPGLLLACHHCITASVSACHNMGGTMKTEPSIPDDLARDIAVVDQIQLRLLPPTSTDGAESGSLRDIMIMTKAIAMGVIITESHLVKARLITVEALGKLGWLPIGKSRMLDCNYCVVQVMGIVITGACWVRDKDWGMQGRGEQHSGQAQGNEDSMMGKPKKGRAAQREGEESTMGKTGREGQHSGWAQGSEDSTTGKPGERRTTWQGGEDSTMGKPRKGRTAQRASPGRGGQHNRQAQAGDDSTMGKPREVKTAQWASPGRGGQHGRSALESEIVIQIFHYKNC
ncbi:hypothetical protein PAXINDRAFT_157638 [Paxillus involutus ATCC 200175]|uniref:Uncharacterized protein n=1 Tax=Paxillus involutus ATCC 200175 TaxID=664439 RepID=A0A0C9TI21_PAXIN|nr:hypothetical protein PAXINDRAFT_157638 [Paxillus involutus ATCC 200175]